MKIGIDAYYGIEYLASKPTMLNSSQYAELSNLAYKNAGKDPLYADTSNMPYSTNGMMRCRIWDKSRIIILICPEEVRECNPYSARTIIRRMEL